MGYRCEGVHYDKQMTNISLGGLGQRNGLAARRYLSANTENVPPDPGASKKVVQDKHPPSFTRPLSCHIDGKGILPQTVPHLLPNTSVLLAKPRDELRVVRVLKHPQHVMVHQYLSTCQKVGGGGGASGVGQDLVAAGCGNARCACGWGLRVRASQ